MRWRNAGGKPAGCKREKEYYTAYNITDNTGTQVQLPESREISQRFQVRSPRDNKFYALYNTGIAEMQGTFSVAILIENLLTHSGTAGEVVLDPAEYAANDIIKCEINGAKFEWNKANSQSTQFNYCNEGLIKADLDRQNIKIQWSVVRPLDILVADGAAGTPTTQAVYDFVTQLVGATGIEYKGSCAESALPSAGSHGDLYVLSDFDLSYPGENIIGLAVYNAAETVWNKVPIRWLQPDGVTIGVNTLGQTAVKPGSITRQLVSPDIVNDLTLAGTAVQPADLASFVTLNTAQTITGKKIYTAEPEIPSKIEPADSTHTASPATEAQVALKQNRLSGAGLAEYTNTPGILTERGITDALSHRPLDGSSANAVTERAVKAALPEINDSVDYDSAVKIYAPAAKSNAGNYLGGQMQWVQPDTEPAAGSAVLVTSGGVHQAILDSIRTWATLTGKPFEQLDSDGFSVTLAGVLINELSNKAEKLDHEVSVSLTGDMTGTEASDLSGGTLQIATELAVIGNAGTSGEAADRTVGGGDTFKALQISTDAKGRVTGITEKLMTLADVTGGLDHNITLTLDGDVQGSVTGNLSQPSYTILTGLADAGAEGIYGEDGDKTVQLGDAFKVLQITTDAKGRVAAVNPRNIRIINDRLGNVNIYTGNLYHNQYVNTGIKLVTNESFSFVLHGESAHLDFHSRWGESVPLSWIGNVYPQSTFSYSEDADGFLWLNWHRKSLFSGRELLMVCGHIEQDISVADREPVNLVRPWASYDNSQAYAQQVKKSWSLPTPRILSAFRKTVPTRSFPTLLPRKT